MIIENKKVGVISLGCDKNRVDTEKMLSILAKKHVLTNEIENAEIIVVNTCAFLESSRIEAIDEIMQAYEYKKIGKLEKLIMTGCLPQKFIRDIFDDLKEVDIFLGVSDYDKILDAINLAYEGKRVNLVGEAGAENGTNRVLTTTNYAYLKIADGCSNHCTYCLIPKIRGKYRSVPKEDLLLEAKNLGDVQELILVAQDTTKYGSDIYCDYNLVSLIRDLTALDNVKSIRLL